MNGSTIAVSACGTTSMSLSLIACQPRIDEPSKPKPSSKLASVRAFTGIVKCFCVPGKIHEPQVDGADLSTFGAADGQNFTRGMRRHGGRLREIPLMRRMLLSSSMQTPCPEAKGQRF